MNWKIYFDKLILNRGHQYYRTNQLKIKYADHGHYEAKVYGTSIYNVIIDMDGGEITQNSCDCPYALSGKNCKHMAAVLYWIENNQSENKENYVDTLHEEKTDDYIYYDTDSILQSMKISPNVMDNARKLVANDIVQFTQLNNGYVDISNAQMLHSEGRVVKENREIGRVYLLINKNTVKNAHCSCYECIDEGSSYYYDSYSSRPKCKHIAALLILTDQKIREDNIGDETDKTGGMLLNAFSQKKKIRKALEVTKIKSDGLVRIEPKLEANLDDLRVSFKIGWDRLYMIKNLSVFSLQVKKGEVGKYGKSTEIPHDVDSFDGSRKYIEFIRKQTDEAAYYEEKMARKYNVREKENPVGSYFNLHGVSLDEFYQLIEGETIEYHDKTATGNKKVMIKCSKTKPNISMHISKITNSKNGKFEGVRAECQMPKMYFGNEGMYYIDDVGFNKVDQDFADKIRILAEAAKYRTDFSFTIGRNKLSKFYHHILPDLKEIIDVEEDDLDEIKEHLRPQVEFRFYLDAEDDNVTCKADAVYGDEIFLVFDDVVKNSLRDIDGEAEVKTVLNTIFPYVNKEENTFHCNCDPELIYDLLESGMEELWKLGEVNCTDSFRNLNIKRKTKISVGITLNNGLLDLTIATEDLSDDELLEVLESYKKKKKYHRLRNGDFIATDDDGMGMINDIITDMGIPVSKLKDGNISVPAFRSMYLDKKIGENEGISIERDAPFRNLIKDFKTISDSDFEAPIQLQKILRNYQINGYKWLRTIEHYGFGGILADDMGLGKTLQMISVLLQAINNDPKAKSHSLIICPASLVFNWMEEFSRFAPDIKVGLVVGSQEQRKVIIEDYSNYHVLVTSYDLLKRDVSEYKGKKFEYQVIDEAQYIKNHSTSAAKAVKQINSRVRFALTGTPIENRLSELWSIFDYLMPGFLYKYETFRRNFEKPIVKDNDQAAMARLQSMVAPFILRRLKQDVLKELPDKLEKIRLERFEGEQRVLYDAQVVNMKRTIASQDDKGFQKNKLQILSQLTKLRQICCDPSLCFENYHGGSAKREGCLELVQSAIEGGHKVLLFSQFTTMLDLLKADFDKEGISYYVITGSTPKENRIKLVNAFNKDDTQVFLISLKAGGTGLNLIGADVVIHYDPWWNLAVQNQATDRAHRIGQTKIVTEYKLIIKDTIEEKIVELQEKKKELADQIINGDGGQLTSMSREDLLELLNG